MEMDRDLQRSLKRIEQLEAKEAQARKKRQRLLESVEKSPALASFEVPSAPEYFPTEEEFSDPLAYIASIEEEASRFGLCKIVPPASWKPQFQPRFNSVANDPNMFYTKRQVVTKKIFVPLEHDNGLAFRIKVRDGYRFFDLASFEKHAGMVECKRSGVASVQDEIAKEDRFWKNIAETQRFSVQYGSDMAGSASNEAFGAWELTSLSNSSMLDCIRGGGLPDICGVNLPMLYIGQLYSMFAWHYEDNALQAINYHHKGNTKTWYGVPGPSASALEAVIEEAFPHDATAANSINKVTMVSPSILLHRRIPVFHLWQRPGDIVVTFPLAHHCGFSHGFSVGEAVNFAMPSWIPYGFASLQRYQQLGMDSVLDMEHAIVFHVERRMLHRLPVPPALAQCALLLLRWQLAVMDAAAAQGVGVVPMTRAQRSAAEQSSREDFRVLCSHGSCRHTMHLCFLVALRDPDRRCCPEHAALLASAPAEHVRLMVRYPRDALLRMLAHCTHVLPPPPSPAATATTSPARPEHTCKTEPHGATDGVDTSLLSGQPETSGVVEAHAASAVHELPAPPTSEESCRSDARESSTTVVGTPETGGFGSADDNKENSQNAQGGRPGSENERNAAAKPAGDQPGHTQPAPCCDCSGAASPQLSGAELAQVGRIRAIGGEILMDLSGWNPDCEAASAHRPSGGDEAASVDEALTAASDGKVNAQATTPRLAGTLSFPRSPFFVTPAQHMKGCGKQVAVFPGRVGRKSSSVSRGSRSAHL